MAIHAYSKDVEDQLAVQRRNATLTSMLVALCVTVLLGLLLAFLLLESQWRETPEIITYAANVVEEEVIERPEVQNQVERKPSAPSSSMAKVIAASTTSPVSIPTVDSDVDAPTLDFGTGDDFGSGWGSGSGSGAGGGGGATFFSQKVKAERICFVIDYSQSMGGKRIQLLKKELTRSVKELPAGVTYQLIFFAGPAWIAGDEVKMASGKKSAVVVHEGRDYKWDSTGSAHKWDTKGSKMRPEWRSVNEGNIQRSLEAIEKTPLVWGTAWESPLEMALDMKDTPNAIFFMTDGSAGPNSLEIAKKIARRARGRDVVIHSVALMEPSVGDAMKELAEGTGGAFTMVNANGSTKTVVEAK